MSEAESYPSSPTPDAQVTPDAIADPLSDNNLSDSDQWETVDFPNAISLDAIPLGEPTAASQTAPSPAEWATLTATLQHENTRLYERIEQLEQTLSQLQTQAIASRPIQPIPTATASTEALEVAQTQISRLFQELELSHQTSQRQQVLVETLQKELQDRENCLNQLEQECAIAQARYQEQFQQRLQAESDCCDLRMRLQRQQQQTLQFKAALERALEMATNPTSSPSLDAIGNLRNQGSEESAESKPVGIQPIVVSNSPVRPWSAPASQSAHRLPDALIKPLAKLLESVDGVADSENSEDSEEADLTPEAETVQLISEPRGDSLRHLFPERPRPVYQADAVPNQIFDPKPLATSETVEPSVIFFAAKPAIASEKSSEETEEIVSDQGAEPGVSAFAAATEAVTETETGTETQAGTETEAIAESSHGEDPLWQDLAKLIEPTAKPANLSVDQAVPELAINSELSPELAENPTPVSEPTEAPANQPPLTAQTRLRMLVPDLATNQLIEASASLGTVPSFSKGWPSPVIYPERNQIKKRHSLAAVELPTFPRKQS